MVRNRAFIALGLLLGLPNVGWAQRETFNDTSAIFDFSRQAVVFTDVTLFRELAPLISLDLREAEASTWLPWGLISIGEAPPVDPTFQLKYSFLLLNPLDYSGPVFGDQIAAMAHVVEAGGVYKTNLDVGEWYPGGLDLEIGGGAEILFSRLASTQTPDLNKDIGFTKKTSPFVYGTEWVGSVRLNARVGEFLRWQSKLRFQKRSAINPGSVSLDGRGALRFVDRDDISGVQLALFDEFEIAGVGLAGEVQHGESAWNFKQMLMAGIREKILVPKLSTTFELGFKGFDGFSTNLVELNVAYLNLPEAELIISAGGRLGFDGQMYSARAAITYENIKAEGTLQFTNRYGEPDRTFGFGVGVGGIARFFMKSDDPPPGDVELAVYYNFLDHLDQMPGLRGTLFITGRAMGQVF